MTTAEQDRFDDERNSQHQSLSLIGLFYVIAYKQFVLLTRYPVNTASKLLGLIVIFLMVFFGGQAVAGPALHDSLSAIIVGFFIWTLASSAYADLSHNVTKEAQWGTLERLFMSPHGVARVFGVKTTVNVFMSFLWGSAVLLVAMLISGRWVYVDPFTVIPLGILTICSVVGIGFVFAGLAIVYKRIENVFDLIQFGFIGLIAAPVEAYTELKLLPLSHGSYLLFKSMEEGARLWELPHSDLVLLSVTAVAYLLLGYYVFHRAQRRARADGLLGQY